ncbi:carboxymuconolactone decarboxylase family protein [Longilinea arvoryzae]|nr:carboxymuconolactone decarboxylase family protein [Longilinea arvoryzae]
METFGKMAREIPGTIGGFGQMHAEACKAGALDHKTKELMNLAIAIVIRCEGCITSHMQDAIKLGATREEILETIGVAVMMAGGPGTVYGSKAYEAMDQFLKEKAKIGSNN